MRYSVFDPTGNITALVRDPVAPLQQPVIAAGIMRKHPEVEQVGFVSFDGALPALRMAGGEFCGNASMSAAALLCMEQDLPVPVTVRLRVSGAASPVAVRLVQREGKTFSAVVSMPAAKSIRERVFSLGAQRGALTVAALEGISHILIEPDSPFFSLLEDPAAAETAVRRWCGELGAEGLGLMFRSGDRLTPLVFVPGSDTVFWETSCASGTAAAGMAIALKTGARVDCAFREPGGCMRVSSDPQSGETMLEGTTRLIGGNAES